MKIFEEVVLRIVCLVANVCFVEGLKSLTLPPQPPFQFQDLSPSPAIFETVGSALFYKNTWTIFTKMTPMDSTAVLNFTDICDKEVLKLCASLSSATFQQSCALMTNEIRVITNSLRLNNIHLQHVFAHRRNKRALNVVGHFAKWAFGTMDSDDSGAIYKQLRIMKGHDKQTLDLIRKQITVMNSNFDRLNKPVEKVMMEVEQMANNLNNISAELNQYTGATNNEITTLQIKTKINELILFIISKLLEIENRQMTELSIVNDLFQQKLHPFIFDTSNLAEILDKITHTTKFKMIFQDLSVLHQAAKLSTYPEKDSVIIRVSIPLPEVNLFDIRKIYPIATRLNTKWDLILEVNAEYIAEDQGLYVDMTNEEFNRCIDVSLNSSSSAKICKHNTPIHTSGSSECVVELLQHATTSSENCKYVAIPARKGTIIKMSTSNQWLLTLREPLVLNFNCDGTHYAPTLRNLGILKIQKSCEVSTKEFRIPYEELLETNVEIQQLKINHTDLIEALRIKHESSPMEAPHKLPPLKIGNHANMLSTLSEGKKALNELEKEADLVEASRKANDQSYEVQVHRYSMISISSIVLATIIIGLVAKLYRSRRISNSCVPPPVFTISSPIVHETPRVMACRKGSKMFNVHQGAQAELSSEEFELRETPSKTKREAPAVPNPHHNSGVTYACV